MKGNGRQTIRDVQLKTLDIMKYIDRLCRDNGIVYYIMGGTALGAVRHGGFIPWDDDLDIFMTPQAYASFRTAMERDGSPLFVLQEWSTSAAHLEYAKVRMNGTTFIEEGLKDRKDLHHGIYVDIMMLHKVPCNRLLQLMLFVECKFVTLYALSGRNWHPKTFLQNMALRMLPLLPCQWMADRAYAHIYSYDSMESGYKYCYWITPAGFSAGLFESSWFDGHGNVRFEDTTLMCPADIRAYLACRYGDYMRMPPEEKRMAAIHAMTFDTQRDYTDYMDAATTACRTCKDGTQPDNVKKYRVGYTTGVFDMFHVGHLNIIRSAKEMCDTLIVGVTTDALCYERKGKYPIIAEDDRKAIVGALKYVDKVVTQADMDKVSAVRRLGADAVFVGSDWRGTSQWDTYEQQLAEAGCSVVWLKHTDGISSSILRDRLMARCHDNAPDGCDKGRGCQ